MRGMVLGYNGASGEGMATTDAGDRFAFMRNDWLSATEPTNGMKIDFAGSDGRATQIYAVPAAGVDGQGIVVKTPDAQNATKFGAIALGCSIGGIILPVIGLILAVAAVFCGIKGYRFGRASGDTFGLTMSIIGMVISGLVLVSYVWSIIFFASVFGGLGAAGMASTW